MREKVTKQLQSWGWLVPDMGRLWEEQIWREVRSQVLDMSNLRCSWDIPSEDVTRWLDPQRKRRTANNANNISMLNSYYYMKNNINNLLSSIFGLSICFISFSHSSHRTY